MTSNELNVILNKTRRTPNISLTPEQVEELVKDLERLEKYKKVMCKPILDIMKDLERLEKQDEMLNIFKSIVKRKDAIITCPCIKEGRTKTNIVITLDTLNDKDILCNETIKEWLNDK